MYLKSIKKQATKKNPKEKKNKQKTKTRRTDEQDMINIVMHDYIKLST